MNFDRLEKNILDVMEEQHIKLGFDGNTVWLFYPLTSLNALLNAKLSENEMLSALRLFVQHTKVRLGNIEVNNREGRFSFAIPSEGSEYVRKNLNESKFIVQFIRTISKHGCTIDELLSLCRQYSEHVHFERMRDNSEFDYLIYFTDGVPDEFYYCIKEDLGHMTYHHFTREDYHGFDF